MALSTTLLPLKLQAQRICPTPTDDARWDADFHLTYPSPELRAVLSRYRVAAKRSSDLHPLTDRDAARCRQLDSLYDQHPVYYWRSGRVILGSNLSDSLPRLVKSEWYPTFRVFDEHGVLLYPA